MKQPYTRISTFTPSGTPFHPTSEHRIILSTSYRLETHIFYDTVRSGDFAHHEQRPANGAHILSDRKNKLIHDLDFGYTCRISASRRTWAFHRWMDRPPQPQANNDRRRSVHCRSKRIAGCHFSLFGSSRLGSFSHTVLAEHRQRISHPLD